MTGLRARLLLAVLGGAVLTTVATGHYLRYVRPGMRYVLVATGAVLLLLAVQGALRDWRAQDEAKLHNHDPHQGPARHGSAWLMLAPVVCLALFAPPALGSFSAQRATEALPIRVESGWPPLPADDVVPLTLGEFVTRARWDESRALAGRTVRLTGFVVPASDGDSGLLLVRMAILCCAADAAAYRVRLDGGPDGSAPPAADTWVEVEGRWVPSSSEPSMVGGTEPAGRTEPPKLEVLRMRIIEPPAEPYE